VIISESNLLHIFAKFNPHEGLSECVCQHLCTCQVLDLDLVFGNDFMNQVVQELQVQAIRLEVALVVSLNGV